MLDMAIQQHLYRVTKRAIDALPPSLLRARPYGVFSVKLEDRRTAQPAEIDDQEGDWHFAWIDDRNQLESIAFIADDANLRLWNGETQRVAVAWRKQSGAEDQQPVGVAWIATGEFGEQQLGIHMDLAPGQAWLHSAVVVPEWRKQGVYRALLEFLFESLRQQGTEQVLMGVSIGNVASLRSHQAVGATSIGKIVAVRSLGLTVCMVRGAVQARSGRPLVVGRRIQLAVTP